MHRDGVHVNAVNVVDSDVAQKVGIVIESMQDRGRCV